MRERARVWTVVAVFVLAAQALVRLAVGQDFPDEPGRDTLLLACTQCHSLAKMPLAELNDDDWEFVVYDMIARGAPVHQEELSDLVEYLQNNFATENE